MALANPETSSRCPKAGCGRTISVTVLEGGALVTCLCGQTMLVVRRHGIQRVLQLTAGEAQRIQADPSPAEILWARS